MEFEPLEIADLVLIKPKRFADARGFFSEVWSDERFSAACQKSSFVQDNHSLSRDAGVVRGLHLQIGATAQGKLVRVTRGAIHDVAVDVRHGSPSFGRPIGVVLSEANWCQLWIPPGFLHGFCTLEPDTEVIYKVTAPYDPTAERGVAWDDPDLGIAWPVAASAALLSDKDRALPRLRDCPIWFRHGA